MQRSPNITPPAFGNGQMALRCTLRLLVLGGFAAFGNQGFGRSLASLLVIAAIYCVVVAAARREPIVGPELTHWDEAAIYLLICWVALLLT